MNRLKPVCYNSGMSLKPAIRPFEAADAEAVTALLEQVWQHDPKMLHVYSLHRAWPAGTSIRHTLVAEVDGEVVGVGSLVESDLHPRMLWAAINVAPAHQRCGVGTALYEALEILGDGRPWMVRLTLRDKAGTSFLNKRGYYNPRDRVRSIMGVLDPTKDAVKRWLEGLPRDVPGYSLLPLDDPANPATLEDVARVQAKVYRQYHAWNPPVEEPLSAALSHYCGPSVLAGSHLCVLEGERLIGAANLFSHRLGAESEEAYLAHVGVAGVDHPRSKDLTAALIRRTVEWAGERRLKVRFEADQEYVPHHAVYLSAPADEIDRDFAVFVNGG